MDIWNYVILVVALYLAYKLGQASILAQLKEDLRRRIITGEITASETVRDVLDLPPEECRFDVERHGEQYFAYAEGGEFLAQGNDFRSMFQNIKQRFPGRNFRINRLQSELTEEESQRMVHAVFDVFGDNNDRTRR